MSIKIACFWTQDTRGHGLGMAGVPSLLRLGLAVSLKALKLHFRASRGMWQHGLFTGDFSMKRNARPGPGSCQKGEHAPGRLAENTEGCRDAVLGHT